MTNHTTSSKVVPLEVIEVGARRRWSVAEKLRIVAESFSGPRLVSATARRHGLSVNQLFVWRRLARAGKLDGNDTDLAAIVPVIVAPQAEPSPTAQGGRIEVVLSEPRRLVVEGAFDVEAVVRLASALARP